MSPPGEESPIMKLPLATFKRLIVLCDGTWQNSLSSIRNSFPTNVTRFSRALSKFGVVKIDKVEYRVPQIIFYQPGVGTGGFWDRVTGGVYGAGLSANVRAAYGFLAHNYSEGDQIYFFGYSRGAYTARAIAGLIDQMGLLNKRGMDRFSAVYQEYYKTHRGKKGESEPDTTRLRELAGNDLHVGVEKAIEIVGVWDTVDFHGAGIGGEKFEFWNEKLSGNVGHGFHALSLDETREAFLPVLWESAKATNSNAKQVWFCGTHEIGGGDQDSSMADIALGWMIAECHNTGKLSFVDIDIKNNRSPATEWYLLDSSRPPVQEAKDEWKTADRQTRSKSFFGRLLGVFKNFGGSAQNMFWNLTNLVLPWKSGVRTPNKGGLVPGETNECIHRSIQNRDLDAWPCGPIEKREGPGTRWIVRHNKSELQVTENDIVENDFEARMRPVTQPLP